MQTLIFPVKVFWAFLAVLGDIVIMLGNFLHWLAGQIRKFILVLIDFFGPTAMTIAGELNPQDLYRVVMLSFSVGGGFWGALEYMDTHLNEYVTNPYWLSIGHAFFKTCQHNHLFVLLPLVLFFGDAYRRKYLHGVKLSDLNSSTPVPTPVSTTVVETSTIKHPIDLYPPYPFDPSKYGDLSASGVVPFRLPISGTFNPSAIFLNYKNSISPDPSKDDNM